MPRLADRPRGDDSRVILHFDYDCFYASVIESTNPALKTLPLAVQQKQIIVTCNYEARRRGLYKLQLVTEARRLCPDVVVVLGEDLDRFRDASKANFKFLAAYAADWGGRAERLGLDEVWLDATALVDFNASLGEEPPLASGGRAGAAPSSAAQSWFALSRTDPLRGFWYAADRFAGNTWPSQAEGAPCVESVDATDPPAAASRTAVGVRLRLLLGSHLAAHVRHALEERRGYCATVGVSVNKVLSKLVGGVRKPRAQTTLVGTYFTGVEAAAVGAAGPAGAGAESRAPDWKDIRRAELARLHSTYTSGGYDAVAGREDSAEDMDRVGDYGWHGEEDHDDTDDMLYNQDDGLLPPASADEADSAANATYFQAAPPKAGSSSSIPSTLPSGTDVALSFLSGLEIGKIPGIGFKTSQALRSYALGRPAAFSTDLVYGPTKEHVTVHSVRSLPGISPALLSSLLSGPGAPRDIGQKIWSLLHGVDHSEVAPAKTVPSQISIEDSYLRLDSMDEVHRQMQVLTLRLMGRMRADLRGGEGEWLAHAHTLRLTIRPRARRRQDGTRERSFKRISRSGAMPGWVHGEGEPEGIAERLVRLALVPMFRALCPERRWDLSLLNVAAVGIVEAEGGKGAGDIRRMFGAKKAVESTGEGAEKGEAGSEEGRLGESEVVEEVLDAQSDASAHDADMDMEFDGTNSVAVFPPSEVALQGSEDFLLSQASVEEPSEAEDWCIAQGSCEICGAVMPLFAQEAHLRFHMNPD